MIVAILLSLHTAIAQSGDTFEVTAPALNIREKPDRFSAILVEIPNGTIVEKTGRSSRDDRGSIWLEVKVYSGGITGWVNSRYLFTAEARPQTPHALVRRTIVIVYDRETRKIGLGQGDTPSAATEDALKNCIAQEGHAMTCTAILMDSYAHCAAVAIDSRGRPFTANASTISDAKRLAMEKCDGQCAEPLGQCLSE